ncbi:uncharacterized protein LOC144761323 [Lissotriton helveticus]
MEQQAKCRAKSPMVMVDAHFLNQKEEEELCDKLDGIHYQHYCTMSTLRKETNQTEMQCRKLLAQRKTIQRTTLDHVMSEIRCLKVERPSSIRQRHNTLLKPGAFARPSSASPRLGQSRVAHASSCQLASDGVGNSLISDQIPFLRRAVSDDEWSKYKLRPATSKTHEASSCAPSRKPRAVSSRLRKMDSTTDTMTYRKLEGLAKIENISLKEAERTRQDKIMEKEKISQMLDDALQQKINHFLEKFEDKRLHSLTASL